MFITNFSLDSHSQGFILIILAIAGIALLISLYLLIIKKTEKETFKITKEEYEKLSEIYYDDLNNRR